MQFKISVIVPVYKVEKYLRKCLDSLICQTYNNFEIIIVNDGSPDGCPEICDEYAQKYDFVFVYHKPNGGISSARNCGVEHATSEWVAFVDSDDYVEPTYVEDLWKLQQQYQADMAVSPAVVREYEDGSGRPALLAEFEPYCVDCKTALFKIYTSDIVGWAVYGKLMRRDTLLKFPFPAGYYEDCACMYKFIGDCEKIAIGNFEIDYHYVNRNGSILKSKLKKEHFRIFEVCDEFRRYINQRYPDLKILSVILYRLAITQMLNCQLMSWSSYKKIYKKYRPLFRFNLVRVLTNADLSNKQKYFMIMHCLTPGVFKLQNKMLVTIRKSSFFNRIRKSR